MKKIYIILVSLMFLVILFLIITSMLGYKFNKNFISFNKQQCINEEYPTYFHHSGIAGCIFWMRHDYLEKTQSWGALFKKDTLHCSQKYSDEDKSGINSLFSGEASDPKCNYSAFKKLKRDENWDYLISKEKDGFYNYCIDQSCPNEPLFK